MAIICRGRKVGREKERERKREIERERERERREVGAERAFNQGMVELVQ